MCACSEGREENIQEVVLPAKLLKRHRVDVLVEDQRDAHGEVLQSEKEERKQRASPTLNNRELTMTANPFARMEKGRISTVYATNKGEYAIS